MPTPHNEPKAPDARVRREQATHHGHGAGDVCLQGLRPGRAKRSDLGTERHQGLCQRLLRKHSADRHRQQEEGALSPGAQSTGQAGQGPATREKAHRDSRAESKVPWLLINPEGRLPGEQARLWALTQAHLGWRLSPLEGT